MTLIAPLVLLLLAGIATWLAGPLVRAASSTAPAASVQALVVAAAAFGSAWLWRGSWLRAASRPGPTALRRVGVGLLCAFLPTLAGAAPWAILPLLAGLGLLVGPELRAASRLARSERPPPLAACAALLSCALLGPFLAPYLDARRAALVVGLCALPWALAGAPGPRRPRERNIFGALVCLVPAWALSVGLGATVTLIFCFVAALAATWKRADRATRLLSVPRGITLAMLVLVAAFLEGAVRNGYPISFVDPEFPVVRAARLDGEWLLLRARDAAAADLAFHGEKGAFLDRLAERRVAEALVHPTLSSAPSRKRILVVGGECTPTLREILRHPDVEHVTQIVLYPHWWRFCDEVPLLAPPHDPRVKIHRVTTTRALVQRFKAVGENAFDAAIVNLPETVRWPAKAHTAGFHSALRGLVRSGGVLGVRLADMRRPAFTGCLWATVRVWWPQTRPAHVLAHLVGSLTTDTVLVFASEKRLDPARVHFPSGTRAYSDDNRDLLFTFGADRKPWVLRAPPPEDCTQFLDRGRS